MNAKMERRNFLQSALILLPGLGLLRGWAEVFSNVTKTNKMNKTIARKTDFQFKQAFPGLKGVDIMANAFPIEPILVFTEYHMDQPVFGPHPHAGISVMTYMLPDSRQGFINRDSLGDFSHIEPGGLHISQAGSGMFHDEFPKKPGIDTHGFQIWINHKETDRWVEPKSMHADAHEIPEVLTEDFKLRIIHGAFGGKRTAHQLVTDIQLFHIFLHPGKSIVLDADEMAFVYGLNGSATIDNTAVNAQTLINFHTSGNKVQIGAGTDGFELMFATAKPIGEPIVYGGPFVMTTNEQMRKTQQRYANGEMGKLEPYGKY